jgi:hypothetical protein
MNGIDHFDVELETDPSGIDHFDVELPDQQVTTVFVPPPASPITVAVLGDDIIIQTFEIGIPGPPGPSGIGGVFGEVPGGALNGSNLMFSTSQPFNKLIVFLNGLKQRPNIDFYVTAPNQFSLTSAPLSGDSLLADYYSG